MTNADRGADREGLRFRARREGYVRVVRAMFVLYLVVIVTGVVGFSLLGILGR